MVPFLYILPLKEKKKKRKESEQTKMKLSKYVLLKAVSRTSPEPT